MKKMRNNVEIEGLVYEFKLEEKVSGEKSKNPGTKYLSGTVSIATDEKMENIVTVHFGYVTPTWKSGSENQTYTFLKKLINKEIFSVMNADKEKGQKPEYVLLNSSSLRLEEWYTKDDKLAKSLRSAGGFFHTVEPDKHNPRATFDVDMVITKATRLDEDEEKQLPERMALSGFIFNYDNSIMPVSFELRNPTAMNYFENEGVNMKNPMFTRIKGSQINQKIVTKKVTESLFDEDIVDEMVSNNRVMLVTNLPKEPYDWDDDSTITAEEMNKLMHAREIMLAEKLAEHEERKKNGNKNSGSIKNFNDVKDEDFGF